MGALGFQFISADAAHAYYNSYTKEWISWPGTTPIKI